MDKRERDYQNLVLAFCQCLYGDKNLTIKVYNKYFKNAINEMFMMVDPKIGSVIRYRFGFTSSYSDLVPKTLDEIGEIFHITRQRVRQIEAKGLRILRHPKYISVIDKYITKGDCHG